MFLCIYFFRRRLDSGQNGIDWAHFMLRFFVFFMVGVALIFSHKLHHSPFNGKKLQRHVDCWIPSRWAPILSSHSTVFISFHSITDPFSLLFLLVCALFIFTGNHPIRKSQPMNNQFDWTVKEHLRCTLFVRSSANTSILFNICSHFKAYETLRFASNEQRDMSSTSSTVHSPLVFTIYLHTRPILLINWLHCS